MKGIRIKKGRILLDKRYKEHVYFDGPEKSSNEDMEKLQSDMDKLKKDSDKLKKDWLTFPKDENGNQFCSDEEQEMLIKEFYDLKRQYNESKQPSDTDNHHS